jgi:4'-phosphopantetheinyl transferase
LRPGEAHVWRIRLDDVETPPPTTEEIARAERFHSPELARRYLRAHGALRDILNGLLSRSQGAPREGTAGPELQFASGANGKPWLPSAPGLKFNLSRSHGMALVAVALEADIGVDVEGHRPLPEYAAIAERFFPPGAPAPEDERDFFRHWTRIEAMLKARGVGLYGMGAPLEGEWTVAEIDAGEGFAAAVAATTAGLAVAVHDYPGCGRMSTPAATR